MNNELLSIIRPKSFDDYFGQAQIINELKVYIYSAKKQKTCLDHILLIGPSGMGKTSLSYVISNEMNSKIRVINAPMIATVQDLVEILASIKENEIFFIDEIHRLDKKIEEILYSVMDDFIINLTYKSEEKTKVISIKLPRFTLIGATTLEGYLSVPLRDRFAIKFHFEPYCEDDLAKIALCNATKFNVNFEEIDDAKFFIKRVKNNPRILNNLLKRLSDYCLYMNKNSAKLDFLKEFFTFVKIDEYGLTLFDQKIIKTLYEVFQSEPVSLESLASVLNENVINLKENYEPYLVTIGIIARTRRGRMLTKKGQEFYFKYIR